MPAKCMPKGAKVRTLQAAFNLASMCIILFSCIHVQQRAWHDFTSESTFACKSAGVHVKWRIYIDRAAVTLIIMTNHVAVAEMLYKALLIGHMCNACKSANQHKV